MSNEPKQRDQARQQRLRAALRENLKRRKSQAKGRSGVLPVPEDGGEQADLATDPPPVSAKD